MICPKAVVYTKPVTPSVEHAEEYGDSFDAGKGTSSRRNRWTGKTAPTPETNSHQTATGIMCTRQHIVANRYYGHTQAAFSDTTSRYIMRCHVVFLLRS